MHGFRFSFAFLAAAFFFTGCGPQNPPPDSNIPKAPAGSAAEFWKEFSGDRAMEHVRRQVELGPRPSGTATIEKARQHITEALEAEGWEVQRQEFDAATVRGRGAIKFVNLIGRFRPKPGQPAPADTQRVIVCSHYDTKRMDGITFVGANDGGSSTGALIELARVLAQQPALAQGVELVFFDGEEAIERYADAEKYDDSALTPDGLVGSCHYARQLRAQKRNGQFRFAILWDMIGEKNVLIEPQTDSPPALVQLFANAARALNLLQHFRTQGPPINSILDDHVPLQRIARIPAIDIIDLNYPHWHKETDTLDKLSPASLQAIGQLTLWVLAAELAK